MPTTLPIVCSRETIFGNPFHPRRTERHHGGTLHAYEDWLRRALTGNEHARVFYFTRTGVKLPEDYRDRVRALGRLPEDTKFYCPGCKFRTGMPGICHVSILLKVARELGGSA